MRAPRGYESPGFGSAIAGRAESPGLPRPKGAQQSPRTVPRPGGPPPKSHFTPAMNEPSRGNRGSKGTRQPPRRTRSVSGPGTSPLPPQQWAAVSPSGQRRNKQGPSDPPPASGPLAAGRDLALPLARRLKTPPVQGQSRPGRTDPARHRPHRTRRAAWTAPAYLLDVHVCEGWGRRPPRYLLPSLSPPSTSLPGTSGRCDPGSPPPPTPPAPSAPPPRLPSTATRSPLTQTKWRQSLPHPDPARTIQHPVEGEVRSREGAPALPKKGHRKGQ